MESKIKQYIVNVYWKDYKQLQVKRTVRSTIIFFFYPPTVKKKAGMTERRWLQKSLGLKFILNTPWYAVSKVIHIHTFWLGTGKPLWTHEGQIYQQSRLTLLSHELLTFVNRRQQVSWFNSSQQLRPLSRSTTLPPQLDKRKEI